MRKMGQNYTISGNKSFCKESPHERGIWYILFSRGRCRKRNKLLKAEYHKGKNDMTQSVEGTRTILDDETIRVAIVTAQK